MSEREDEQGDLEPAAENERVGYRRPPMGTRFSLWSLGQPTRPAEGRAQSQSRHCRGVERTGCGE